jgi:tRNA A-37 threonylcarbamoyl transferase component Bud32
VIALSECLKCHTPLPGTGSCSHCDPSAPELEELRERLAAALEGRYEILRLLGRGGMAAVYLAKDLVLEREVAIKVLPPDMSRDPQLIRRFQQEAKTAAKLDHPNIIPIYRVESEAGLVYIVMKYVSGQSLEELASRGPLPIPQVRHILREAALALGHAHRRRVVHRDVKPANIMVDEDGRVVLTDFGISKAVRTSTELTGSGAILGTPHYMAPEQARGHEVDGRTDQYALAIVGHRVLTGKAPFDGDAQAILYQQVFESAPSLLDRRPDTPSDMRRALDRAMAKEAKSRFATMEEFAAALSGERSGPTTVVSEPVATQAGRVMPVQSNGHTAGVFVALGTAAVLALLLWFALPTLLALTERKPTVRAPAAVTADPPRPRPSAVTRPAKARAEPRPTQERKAGSATLRAVRYARLTVSSEPRGTVYVDGVAVGRTPIVNHQLRTGVRQLRIEQSGYHAQAEKLDVKGTTPISRRYKLRPITRR